MHGKPLPDAEQLLKALTESMRPSTGPETGLIGIHTGGVWIAERLHHAFKIKVPLATIDVSFYRDDYDQRGLNGALVTGSADTDLTCSHKRGGTLVRLSVN